MLVAEIDGQRIEASEATKGKNFRCPSCIGELILKQGRTVIHHFAHKPPTSCSWAARETRAHLEAKTVLAEALRARGVEAHIEYPIETMLGDRRADVIAVSPRSQMLAFELQHTSISLDDIERRSFSYSSADIAQIWIPFLSATVWKNGHQTDNGWFVERYSPRPFERWVHGLNIRRGMWMYDQRHRQFWLGSLADHLIEVEANYWYGEGGEERSSGGYSKISKRYKELTLRGPHDPSDLKVRIVRRTKKSLGKYNWPGGKIAHFVGGT